jgi:hypothetical protein
VPQTQGENPVLGGKPDHDLPYNIKVEKNGSSIEIKIPYGREK